MSNCFWRILSIATKRKGEESIAVNSQTHLAGICAWSALTVSGGGNVDESRRFENPVRLTVKN
jgi:hypothetical protein